MRETHILDRFEPLYRYRYIGLAGVALSVLVALAQLRGQAPIYQARTRLQVQLHRGVIAPGMPIPVIMARIVDENRYFQQHVELLRSRELSERAVRAMGLTSAAELDAAPPPRPVTRAATAGGEVVQAFRGRIAVEPIRESLLIDATYQSGNAAFAAAAVNTIASEFIGMSREFDARSGQAIAAALDNAVAAQSERVKATERQMIAADEREDLASLERRQGTAAARLMQTSDAFTRATAARAAREAAYKRSQQAGGPTDEGVPADLLARRAELERERVGLSQRYGPSHPTLKSVASELERVEQQVARAADEHRTAVKRDYDHAVAEERALAKNLDAARAEAAAISRASVEYASLERQANTERQVFESFLENQNAVRLANRAAVDTVHVIEHADAPTTPLAAPRRAWLVTLAGGLALTVIALFGLDYLNDTLQTPDDVSRYLGEVFLGFVPARASSDTRPLLASTHESDEFSESIRAIRTALAAHLTRRGPVTIIGVTSTEPQEGKTTTACNLALALSLAGSRVLVIDTDMRRPRVHDALNLANDKGLSMILQGQKRIRDVIQRSANPNLLVICGGPTPPNPSELLLSKHMRAFVESLRRSPFEWIVIDTPPVLAATDAVVVSASADAMVFVVGSGVARRRLARRALETLTANAAPAVCTVLNRVDVARDRYYYARRYGYTA